MREVMKSKKKDLKDYWIHQGKWLFAHPYAKLCTTNPQADEMIRSLYLVQPPEQAFATFDRALSETQVLARLICWIEDHPEYQLIMDTGATTSLLPSKEAFVDYHKIEGQNISGIAGILPVLGIGKVRWIIHDDDGQAHTILTDALHAPKAQV
jgi:hypothetical protein